MTMTSYCRISDGEVVQGPIPLPKNWKNVSQFESLADSALASYGWLPVNGTPPEYDPRIQNISDPTFVIGESSVTATWDLADRPLESVKTELVTLLKSATRHALLGDEISPGAAPLHKQLNAANRIYHADLMSIEEANAVVATVMTYRLTCNTKEIAILAAATVQEALSAFEA
ncbi:MAG: hypothetical protein H7839_06715 [Magnetococcus sp. YQC-5]